MISSLSTWRSARSASRKSFSPSFSVRFFCVCCTRSEAVSRAGVVAIFHLVHFAETFVTFFIFNIAGRIWKAKKNQVEKVLVQTADLTANITGKVCVPLLLY